MLTVARATTAASFDCKKAAAPVEKMICSDAQLSGLDARLATSYRPNHNYRQLTHRD